VVLARVDTHLKLSETQKKLKKTNDELKELLNEVEYLSFHDEMTGLYNRRYFENELDRLSVSRRLPITLLVADMDNLKIVNDNYGHKMGDLYIKAAAEILKKSSREEDVAARIGGDEFAIILPETAFEAADKVYRRIKSNLREYNQQQNLVEELDISLGFAVRTEKDQNLDQIFKKADKMMYNNKGKKIYSD
jgi:diguanylate cyclase (GGDEF)-like protein